MFDRLGPFDARYRIAGDLEFLLRIPPGAATLHVHTVSVVIEEGGISRTNILARLREQREALARCPRYGVLRAYVAWADKLWRYPVARLLRDAKLYQILEGSSNICEMIIATVLLGIRDANR